MGTDRARVAALSAGRRGWPLLVRRAEAADREPVLAFASATWDGWDYIPNAWPLWLSATDGVLLVGCVGRPMDGGQPADRAGNVLDVGRPVAVARVAMLSPTEAWLEGIRVDPAVRGMDVATDLQVAELHWAARLRASVVRYATGESNEGSHRLGARHGFELTTALRTYWWKADEPASDADEEDDHESGFDDAARARSDARRAAALDVLERAGLVARNNVAGECWKLVDSDASFAAGGRLYEHRAWALQDLTADRFAGHLDRGEVLVERGRRAVAILERRALPAEDVSINLGLLCGDGSAALRLASEIQRAADSSIRFRLPDADASLIRGLEADFAAAGFGAREWTLHILARPLDAAHPPPPIDDAA